MSLASISIKFQLNVIAKHARDWSQLVTGTEIFDRPGAGYLAHGLRIRKSEGSKREILDLFVGDDNTWQLDRHVRKGDDPWVLKGDNLGFDHRGFLTTDSEAVDVLSALRLYVVSRL